LQIGGHWFKFDICSEECVKTKCDFYLNIESVAHLDNPQSLRLLIEQNRQVLAPMLFGSGKGQKNFRGVDASEESCRNPVKIVKDNDRCVSFILQLYADSIEM
jgi:hypothetical protein